MKHWIRLLLYNKSVCKIHGLLELPQSTVSAVNVKWKRLGATMAQPLKHVKIVCPRLQHSLQSSKKATVAHKLFVRNMKWVSMAEQAHTSLRSHCAMPRVGWSGVKLAAIGLWSSGNTFSGVMNRASLSGSPVDESGFGGCQENAAQMHSAN